jgi:ABC-type uncharacterized transport system involved in gliding motility auxiliary subunit
MIKKILGSAAGLAVLLGVVIALNVLVGSLRIRADLTEEKLYTLSAGTRQMLRDLTKDVTLKFYFSRSVEDIPIPLKQYAQRVESLFKEYEAVSRGKVVLEVYDPAPDSDEEEWAQRYGLSGQPMGMLGGPALYFGVVGVCGTKEATIPFIQPGAEPQLEYLLTRLIHEVSVAGKPKIGVLSSLPVMGAQAMPFGPRQRGSQPWVVISELRKQYDVVEVEPTAEEIPADITALLVIHPKQLEDRTLFALDQFVLRGGRLIAFTDPVCIAEQDTSPNPQGMGLFGASSDLNKLTKAWGIEMAPGDVVYDLKAATDVSVGSGATDRLPAWLSLRTANVDRSDITTSPIEFVMMPFAGSLAGSPTGKIEVARLVVSGPDAGVTGAFEVLGGRTGGVSVRSKGQQTMALRLKGHFPSAFPGGAPSGGDTNAPPAAKEALKESAKEGVVVLVSDVDLLFDRFCVREMNIFGQTMYEPSNDNLNLVLNVMEQMAGSEALIGLRSRGTFQRPFERVDELEKQAQQRWQEEEKKLQDTLREAQDRLNELQAAKSQDQQSILSPEQKKEIENFRKQRFETQRQLKEVRKNLRHDIEALGMKLKVLNMALVPALVAVFGLVLGWRRRMAAS